jgi:hypothetical protein
MKKTAPRKTPQKLSLRGQILRVLADIKLSNAVGGLESNNAPCQAAADTGHADCPGWPTH